MAGESITFDFLSRGADRLAGDFRKTGDNAALAARGARLLADSLDRERKAASVSVGATLALAKADDILKEAEHGLRDGALEAEFALKRQAEAERKLARTGAVTGGGGVLGRLFGGGAGAGGAGALSGGAPAAGPLLGGLGAPGAIAAAVAGLASLPFIAQAAGAGIVAAFGGALAGMAIIGAARTKAVQKNFADLKTSAVADLGKIGVSFVPVLGGILATAKRVLGQLTPVFAAAAVTIAGPFQAFGEALAQAFGQPAVRTSIQAVAAAFGAILKAVTPGLASDVGQVADGVKRIANAIAANPQAIASFVSALFKIAGIALDVIAALIKVANYIEAHFGPALHRTAVIFDGVRHEIAHVWDQIFSNSAGSVIRIAHNVETQFNSLRHGIAVVFDGTRRDIAAAWNTIWANTVSRVATGISTVTGWFRGLPGKVTAALSSLGGDLFRLGSAALGQLWAGIKAGAKGIGGWLSTFAKGVIKVFKDIWGWFSPSTVMYEGGKALMQGLSLGLHDHSRQAIANAAAVASAVTGALGGGVQRWRPLVVQALRMEGLSQQLVDAVLYQMSTESGGNPRAINLTDINAQHGDPSRGLMQVIGSTFRAYHWPGTSWDIYNPLANIAAALNYARHNYGPGLRNAYGGIGTGHGYAFGTASAAAGWAWVGERGPELVRFRGGERVAPVIPGGRGAAGHVILEIRGGGHGTFDAFLLRWLRENVRVKGGGSVQHAFGAAGRS